MFLTADELRQLTGLKRKGDQARFLRGQGYAVELDANGRPLVLRSAVEARMGAVPVAKQAEPNWEALRSGT